MILLLKGLNEEKMVPRVIGDIVNEDWVDRIVVIDGGSTDLTVHECRQFNYDKYGNLKPDAKVEVYVHKWEFWYHDNEVSQSNIALSYIPHGEIAFILDFDERISPDLKAFLRDVDAKGMPNDVDTVHVARRSYELMRHEDSPFAMTDPDSDDFFVLSHQTGQYPDFQMRLIRRKTGMHWINSPHHVLHGEYTTANIELDIVHYHGKEDARDRDKIEKLWLRCQARRKQLGLSADVFEADIKPGLAKWANSETWGD